MTACHFKVTPTKQRNVRRNSPRRLETAFDAAGIEIPFPQFPIFVGQAKDGLASPLSLKLVNAGDTLNERQEDTAQEALR